MDVSKKKKTQLLKELNNAKIQAQFYKDLLDNSRDMVYRMSLPDGRYEYVSPSSYELFGYLPQEMYDSPLLIKKIIHPDWLEYFEHEWKSLVKGEMAPFYEYPIIHKSGQMKWMRQRNFMFIDEQGTPTAIEGIVSDVTEQKLAQEALDKRITALTRPLDEHTLPEFEDLFDLDDIQRIQDEFAYATGVAALITRTDGTPITKSSNFCELCSTVIRKTKKGEMNCNISDAELGRFNPDGPIVQQCLSAGLWGAGAAISIQGRHIANFLIGQVRDETQTEEQMREYARRIDADEDELVAAFRKVPVMSKSRFEQIAKTLYTFSNHLSVYAYQNMQQARFITELEQKEAELRERESILREYQQMAQIGHWYWDTRTGDVSWSEEVFKTFKLDPDTFTPQIDSIMELSAPWPGDRDRHTELMEVAMNNRQTGTFEQRFLLPDGNTGFYYSTFQGVFDDDDNLIAMKGTVQDITERKRTEEALKESETQLRTLIRSIPDLVWLKDPDGVYISCNSMFEQFFGAAETEIIGKTDYDFVDTELANIFRKYDKLAMEQGTSTKNEELVTFASDGHTELLETIKTPMYKSNGELAGVLGIGRDITERRLAEEQLQIRERMDSIGTLASGIAHDFNNLLVGIMGNLDLLRIDNEKFNVDQRSCLNESYELSLKAARLVGSLLSLTKNTVSETQNVDIYEVAQEVITILTRTTDRLIEKKLDIQPRTYNVLGQHDQLHQVLLNLGTNAIQAIEEKGVQPGDYIKISASDCDRKDAQNRGFEPDMCIHIVFEDTGSGMTEEIRRKAFEPLFSTKERGIQKGQGLGLAMVYNIITRNHHGLIEIESAPDEGTKFHIYLPKSDGLQKMLATPVSTITGGDETILVVEDEASVTRFAKKALQKFGYSVLSAADGEAGVQMYKIHKDEIDLVILDLTLPKMSGEMVLKGILQINPNAKVIISSGQSDQSIVDRDKIKGFVAKPYKLYDLAKTIREVLDS